jgi:putative peptidoglycan lipid II flippase
MVSSKDWAGIRTMLKSYGALLLAVTVPFSAALALLSTPLVRVLYERGAFTAQDTKTVAAIQAMYVLQVPFVTLGILFVRLISALSRNQIFVWGNLISVIVNAALDYILMKRMGVAGIALSTSIVYLISCTFLGLVVFHYLPKTSEPTLASAGESG